MFLSALHLLLRRCLLSRAFVLAVSLSSMPSVDGLHRILTRAGGDMLITKVNYDICMSTFRC